MAREALALRELESLSGLRTPWLLALDRTGVAREQAEVAELATVRFIERNQRARDGEAERSSLTRLSTTVDVRADIEPTEAQIHLPLPAPQLGEIFHIEIHFSEVKIHVRSVL